jgi:hypothetical protein
MKFTQNILILSSLFLANQSANGQNNNITNSTLSGQLNTVTTAVPFLGIAPDSRSAALGEAGVAISPDVNAVHWNMAKLSFAEKENGFGLSYAPWLRKIVNDMFYSYLSGYTKVGDRFAVGGSFRYFSLGTINYTDNFGNSLGPGNPNEFAVDLGVSTALSKKMSVGVTLRYINSNLVPRSFTGSNVRPGKAGSGDISWYYNTKMKNTKMKKYNSKLALGAVISNLGSKITYTDNTARDFLPANLRIGAALTMDIDEYNSIMFTTDINKLLVPTRPQTVRLANGSDSIVKGKISDVGTIAGAVQSFSDAPDGFSEELKEYNLSFGFEWWYQKQFAARIGYFHENELKGNRQFLTLGLGIRYNVFGLDVTYVAPTNGNQHPLSNQLRFSLLFDLNAVSGKSGQAEKVK